MNESLCSLCYGIYGRCYELSYVNWRTQFWCFKNLIYRRFKTNIFGDGDIIHGNQDVLISMDILDIGNMINGDLDALSFFNEWTYSILATC